MVVVEARVVGVAVVAAAAVDRGMLPCSRRNSQASPPLGQVVKAAIGSADHGPAAYSGHSLRSGFITSAARAGVAERDIQNQSGHRSLPVLRGYIRRGSLFVDNTESKVGL